MEKSFENAYALVIGISKYQDKRISELQYTHEDAKAFSKLLIDPQKIGLKNENVKVLLDENATLSKIKEAFATWLKKADEKSTVFIFFAGHGSCEIDHFSRDKDSMASYLLPYDTNRDSLYASAFSSQDLDNALRIIRSKKLIIFLDSCHSGGVASGARDVKWEEDPYKKLAEGEGRVVISASKPDQLSYEGSSLGHGVFTYHLIEALSGKADTNENGYVSVFELFDYLQKNVPATARDLPNGGQQEPMIRNENIARDFSISINPIRIKINEEERIREGKIRKLREFQYTGKLSGKQYERLRTIIKTANEKLPEKDLNIGRLTESFLAGDLSLDTFLEDLKDIEPGLFTDEPVKPETVHPIRGGLETDRGWKGKDEVEERKKRIIELDLEAKTLSGEGNHTEAITKWKKVLELDPEYDKALKGIKVSEKVLKENETKKRQVEELTIEAKILFKKGYYTETIEKWTEVLDIDPKNQSAKDGIKKAKSKNKEDEKEKMILSLFKDARRLSIEGNHVLAIPKWREILEMEPENTKAIEGLRESQRIIREINELNVYAQRLSDEGMHNRALEKWNEVLMIDINNKIALEGISNTKKFMTEVPNTCPGCGNQFEAGWEFCETCGFRLNQTSKVLDNQCPNCGEQFNQNDIYCGNCGVKLF